MHLLLLFVALAAGLALTGFLYQSIGGQRDRRRMAGHGRWVDIGDGRKHYLLEQGSGSPTVVFEAGIAATNLNWRHLQQRVSQFAATASYDRGGLGWSSPCHTPRTPRNIAVELHQMLHNAGIKPPYLLVGHSFGGLVVRRFALLFPEEVSSVILVDPMRCEEWPPLDPAKQAMVDRGSRLTSIAIPFARLGLVRLAVTALFCRSSRAAEHVAGAAGRGGKHVLGRLKEEVSKMPQEVWPIVAAHWSRPASYAGIRNHLAAVPDTVREMQDAEPIRGIPVLLLTPGNSTPLSVECLQRIGDNVRQLIAYQSAHWIHLDEPQLVIDSIRQMIASAEPETIAALA